MAVTGIGTYASYTNRYGDKQNAGNKTGRTYKNAHEYKNYLTQKYDCLRSRDYSVNINSTSSVMLSYPFIVSVTLSTLQPRAL